MSIEDKICFKCKQEITDRKYVKGERKKINIKRLSKNPSWPIDPSIEYELVVYCKNCISKELMENKLLDLEINADAALKDIHSLTNEICELRAKIEIKAQGIKEQAEELKTYFRNMRDSFSMDDENFNKYDDLQYKAEKLLYESEKILNKWVEQK